MNLSRVLLTSWTCLLCQLAVTAPAQSQPGSKKLIEFGWDEPDTAFLRAHVEQMEQTPFDGCVFHAYATTADGKQQQPFLWECWGMRAFTSEQLRHSLDDLKATQFRRFTRNFLRFNTVPGDVDWFDDYSAIIANAKLAAGFAREGKCAGILFDIEQYKHPLFEYSKQRDRDAKSWDLYAAQARLRGRQVMEAFEDGFPGVTVFLTYGYTLPLKQTGGDPRKLPHVTYGLLAPFLDGMVDGARGRTRIVDGYELSYSFKDTRRFATARESMRQAVLATVADPKRYREVFAVGFGIWLDDDWRKRGWNVQDVQKNFYTPAAFEQTVRAALAASDEYVWIYSETPKWWTATGGPSQLPDAYIKSLQNAADHRGNAAREAQ